MANGKTLIRGASVLTMDDELGTIREGDVLFEGDRITAVGRTLAATGAEVIDGTDCIVMPGFVDTHRHMWGAMLRGWPATATSARIFKMSSSPTAPTTRPRTLMHLSVSGSPRPLMRELPLCMLGSTICRRDNMPMRR